MNIESYGSSSREELLSIINQLQAENQQLRNMHDSMQFDDAQFHAFIGALSDAIVTITPDGRISSMNYTASLRFGKPPAELIGKTPEELFNPEEALKFRHMLEQVKLNLVELSLDEVADGHFIRTKVYPICGPAGELKSVGIIAKDITLIKQYESVYTILLRLFSLSGEEFFQQIVTALSKELDVKYVIIGSITPDDPHSITTIALAERGKLIPNIKYDLNGAPCNTVVGQSLKVYKQNIQQLFPADFLLQEIGAESYIGAPLYSHSGQPLGLVILIDDKPMTDTLVAERILELLAKKAAAELEFFQKDDTIKIIEDKFTTLYLQAPVPIAVARFGRLIFTNSAYAKMFGFPDRLSLIGKYLADNIAPSVRNIISQRNINRESGSQEPNEYETIGIKTDGTEIPLHVVVTNIILEDGPATLAFLSDLTLVKQTEMALKQREYWLRESQRVARIGFYNYHLNEDYWESTEELDNIFGLSAEYSRNLSQWLQIIHPDHRAEMHDYLLNHVLRDKQPFDKEYRIITLHDRVEKWVHGKGELSFDDNGNPESMMGTIQDITDRKQLMHDLLKAKEKAELMNTIKSTFFTNMSHELRTPLIGILGFSELLEEKMKDDPDAYSMAETIHTSGHRLLDTLNLILSLSKLDSEKVIPNLRNIDLVTEIQEIFSLYVPVAEKKGIQFILEILEPEIITIVDAQLFRSVLNNLLNNALKFTDSGRVCVQAWRNDDSAVISVADTGSGIALDKQNIIWQEFRQASEGIGRNFDGTGLGLTIAQRYAQLMHGSIALESEPGMGATFTVKLPLAKDNAALEQAGTIISTTNAFPQPILQPLKKILYVEDDPVAVDYVKRCVKGLYSVTPAVSAKAALAAIENDSFDALLMDINLGKGMDGVQLTAIIRNLPGWENIPIVAITAFAMEEDKAEFLSKGMDYYLSKPFNKSELRALLQQIFR